MNEFEAELEKRFNGAGVAGQADSLRPRILTKVNRELRTRRRDRLATRIVLACFLLAIVGNWASNRHESARMARWFPNALSSPWAFADEETMLVENTNSKPPTASVFEKYLLAFYPTHSIATNSPAARETAAWLDEFNSTGRGL